MRFRVFGPVAIYCYAIVIQFSGITIIESITIKTLPTDWNTSYSCTQHIVNNVCTRCIWNARRAGSTSAQYPLCKYTHMKMTLNSELRTVLAQRVCHNSTRALSVYIRAGRWHTHTVRVWQYLIIFRSKHL